MSEAHSQWDPEIVYLGQDLGLKRASVDECIDGASRVSKNAANSSKSPNTFETIDPECIPLLERLDHPQKRNDAQQAREWS
jgi:hypothetical protein